MRSIRHRLLILLFAGWTSVWAAVALITLERSRHEVAEFFDAELAQTAQMLLDIHRDGILPGLDSEIRPPATFIGHPYHHSIAFQLCREGKLLSRCCGAPETALGQTPGFSDQEIEGTRWRVYGVATAVPEEMLFVGQSYGVRDELVEFLTTQALHPILWSLPLSLLLIWLAVTDGLRPLGRLARAIARRSPQQLTPVDAETVPNEIRPLTDAINGLLDRLRQAMAAERSFTADASHELRTPLAIIKTNAQIVQRSKTSDERNAALTRLIEGVDRASHLVSQLLILSRLQFEAQAAGTDVGSLGAAIAMAVEDQRAAVAAKSIAVAVSTAESLAATVNIAPGLLELLVGNLVSNAVKFTPAGGQVDVSVEPAGERVVLRVSDTGPGIPEAQRERAFERFRRLSGQEIPGSGLGLSIVKRICALYGADIGLRSGDQGRGLIAEVSMRRAGA